MGIMTVLFGGVILLAIALTVVWLVCKIVVMVKAFQNDMAPIAVVGFFVPLVLFVFGWIKANEWDLKKTMIIWTITAVLSPILGIVLLIGIVGIGLANHDFNATTTWPNQIGPSFTGQADDLSGYRGQIGKVLTFDIQGRTNGTIYGTDIYTDDSDLETAAVHAGVLKPGEKGTVRVTILGGLPSYTASTRNGVTSNRWPSWHGSYRVSASDGSPIGEAAVPAAVLPDPGSLNNYRQQKGKAFLFEVVGSNFGPVWGTDVYTDDSLVGAAAVHAGVLKVGQKGTVKVTIMPGQFSYTGSVRNGVASSPYGAWDGSYRVEPAK